MHEAERAELAALLPGLASEDLLDAVLAVDALLVAMAPLGVRRWQRLRTPHLLQHLAGHVAEISEDPARIDAVSQHPTAAHVAARALMFLQRVVWR